ncbi:MAG TPA: hypothetical protein VMR70_00160 [Flavisolibacter sp.]|nr:hypothetical protein [Flavisolibacter sp.]
MKTALLSFFLLPAAAAFSQVTTYLPQGARENVLLERLEIKAGTDSVLNFSKTRPLTRRDFIPAAQRVADSLVLSKADAYNLYMLQAGNIEFARNRDSIVSRKRFLNTFYKTPANFYEVNAKDFHLVINPVFQYVVAKEKNSSDHLFLNSRGLTLRGNIADKVSFVSYITDNQERDPLYVRQWGAERQAVPGQGYFKEFKGTGYDYIDARGYINFRAAKYIDVTFGYDRNFIGNGFRSLYLSEFSPNVLFLKLNTRIWKLNYQNIFMELVSAYQRGADQLLGKKYAAMHHLDVNVTKWLNIGVFEGIVFGQRNRFEFGYLNPVIFYRSAEQQNGSPDNAVLGVDAKANLFSSVQLYGQLILDELKLNELKTKWWGNKFGFQVGAKYIDAFGISNLDLQGEWNRVRPFTYSHDDSVANYTNYNQPLAHPLGANFNELIGQVRYQPIPRLMVHAKAIYYKQGKDIGAANYGSNILLPNAPPYRTFDYGYEVGSGALNKIGYASFQVSYEVKPNLFLEAGAVHRSLTAPATADQSTTIISGGVRWNMHRRDFAF